MGTARRRWLSPAGAAFAVALLAVGAGAFALRVAPFWNLPAPERHRILIDPDCYYHLRVARLITERFPSLPRFDSYLNYPRGAEIPLPPLQGLLAAAAARALPGPPQENLEAIAHYYPAVVGLLAVILVFPLARAFGLGRGAALLAASLSSVVPIHYLRTLAGRFDHHGGDMLFTLVTFLLCLEVWRRERPFAAPVAVASLAVAVTAMVLNFLGSILSVAILALVSLIEAVFLRERAPGLPRFCGRVATAHFAAASLCALFVTAGYGRERLFTLAYDQVSGFQPVLLASAGIGYLLLRRLLRDGRQGFRSRAFLVGAGLLLLAVVVLLGAELQAGFQRYLTRTMETMRGVGENSSPFILASGGGPRHLSLPHAARRLTYAYLLAPIAVAWLLRRIRDAGRDAFPRLLLATWIAVQTALAAFQVRHGVIFSVPIAVGAAWLAAALWRVARESEAGAFQRVTALLGLPLVLATFHPGPRELLRWVRSPAGLEVNADAAVPLAWIARNTPDPGDYLDPARRPAYGVLGPWELGHEIIERARRPAIATGFLDALPGGLFLEAQRFFLEEDPERAREMMERNSLRYILLRNYTDTLRWDCQVLGEGDTCRGYLVALSRGLLPPGGGPVALRLWFRRGGALLSNGAWIEGTRHFRLLREFNTYDRAKGSLEISQVYELVRGARLTGWAAPGELVHAEVPLRIDGGIRILYEEVARAGSDGSFVLTLPYATEEPSGETVPLGPCRVTGTRSGRAAFVRVSEAQVRAGARIEVAFPAVP